MDNPLYHIWYEFNEAPGRLLWIPSPVENDPTRMGGVLVSERFWNHLLEIGYQPNKPETCKQHLFGKPIIWVDEFPPES